MCWCQLILSFMACMGQACIQASHTFMHTGNCGNWVLALFRQVWKMLACISDSCSVFYHIVRTGVLISNSSWTVYFSSYNPPEIGSLSEPLCSSLTTQEGSTQPCIIETPLGGGFPGWRNSPPNLVYPDAEKGQLICKFKSVSQIKGQVTTVQAVNQNARAGQSSLRPHHKWAK